MLKQNNSIAIEYLPKLHEYMLEHGYRKYNQNHKRSTFQYFKNVGGDYQVAIYVYDWSIYEQHTGEQIGLSFECISLNIDGRCDMSMSIDLELEELEELAKKFYEAIVKFLK